MELKEAIGQKLVDANATVLERVATAIAEEQIAKRANAIVSAYGELERLRKETRSKEKPDQVSRNASGEIVSESFSKAAWEALDGHRKRIAKVEKAISAALEGDMKLINELGSKPDAKSADDA